MSKKVNSFPRSTKITASTRKMHEACTIYGILARKILQYFGYNIKRLHIIFSVHQNVRATRRKFHLSMEDFPKRKEVITKSSETHLATKSKKLIVEGSEPLFAPVKHAHPRFPPPLRSRLKKKKKHILVVLSELKKEQNSKPRACSPKSMTS